MPRLDLAFILCCCKACLGSSDASSNESFYALLGIEFDAASDEIKRAYKRQSLQMHPDKLAQRGKTVTPEDQAKFQKMKEAYEVLSDPYKRETYDAIGDRGMKWIEEPLSMDPQEMATNFANSSTLDRSKIFSIFVFFAVAIFIQPLLICLQLDGRFGDNSNWTAVLTPLWIWNACILFYHTRVILMGKMPKPDHIPEDEWKDPLPMKKRITGLVRFLLFFAFEIQLALHLDGVNTYSWIFVLLPLFALETFVLYRNFPQSRLTIVTLEEIQTSMGKEYSEFTDEEKHNIEKAYLLIPDRDGAPYDEARKVVRSAKMEIMKTFMRIIFMLLVLLKIDSDSEWSWWMIFAPFFITSIYICYGSFRNFSEVQEEVEERLRAHQTSVATNTTDYGAMEEGETKVQEGQNDTPSPPLTEGQQEEIRGRVARSGSMAATSCCSQFFFLVLLCLGLSKIQGAGFSTIWIISPFLFFASIILCLLGCMIFCVAPMDEDEMMFDPQNPVGNYHNMDNAPGAVPMTPVPVSATDPSMTATKSAPIVMPLPAHTEIPTFTNPLDVVGEVNSTSSAVSSVPTSEIKHFQVVKENDELKATDYAVESVYSSMNVVLLDIPSDEEHGVAPSPSEVDDLD